MVVIREDGLTDKRTVTKQHDAFNRALRAIFGEAYDTLDGNPIVDLGKSFGLLGVISQEDEMVDIYNAHSLSGAKGSHLDALIEIIGGSARLLAKQSLGEVNITLTSALVTPSPLWAVGDIYFVDVAGNEYELTEDVLPNGTVSVVAKVQSRGTGTDKNIAVNQITGVRHASDAIETFWNANVAQGGQSFTNNAVFSGGRYKETNAEYAARARLEDAANRSGSPPGIAQAILDLGSADHVRVYENEHPTVGGLEDTILAAGAATTNSELVNAAGGAGVVTKIAAKKVISTAADRRWLQHFSAVFAHNSGTPTFTVTIETDASGSPSGVKVKDVYSLAGYLPANGSKTTDSFDFGEYPAASDDDLPLTVWIVFTATAGSAYLKGDTSGAAGDVKVYKDAAWSNDANIDKAAVEIIGGIPPGGYRPVVIGGVANDIAQAINDWHPVGITNDGKDTGTATLDGVNVKRRFDIGVKQELEIEIDVRVNSLYQGGTSTVKDLLIRYAGGIDSDGNEHRGLSIGQDFETDAAKSFFFDSSLVSGIIGFNFLKVDLLGGTPVEQATLSPAFGTKFSLTAANITVTLSG